MLEVPRSLTPAADEALARASSRLGRDLRGDFAAGASAPFARNEDVQIAVFVANHLWMLALAAAGVRAEASLGQSLGEYNHLVHIGAIDFEDALLLVRARGQAYDQGPSGRMIAVQPVTVAEAEAAIARARDLGVVEIVGFNAPTQQILGGEEAAVAAAARWLEDELYAHPVLVERALPMHSSLFRPVAERFTAALEAAPLRAPRLEYLPNRTGTPIAAPTREELVRLLADHVCAPVRWRESVEHVHARRPRATYIEVGDGAILGNLLRRRWLPARALSIGRAGASQARFAADLRTLQEAADAP